MAPSKIKDEVTFPHIESLTGPLPNKSDVNVVFRDEDKELVGELHVQDAENYVVFPVKDPRWERIRVVETWVEQQLIRETQVSHKALPPLPPPLETPDAEETSTDAASSTTTAAPIALLPEDWDKYLSLTYEEQMVCWKRCFLSLRIMTTMSTSLSLLTQGVCID